MRVTDPFNDPLPPFNAYQVNAVDSMGNAITDISGAVNVTMRVRSAEAITIDVLFRSGEGGSDERSDRKSVLIPSGLIDWTEFTINFEEGELGGFNPADLRDMWFYLDRGTENFAGNELYIDHIAIGTEPDSSRYTACSTEQGPQSWQEHWASDNPVILGGSETENLTVNFTECEEVKLEVTDPVNSPYQAFRPIVINPQDENGVEITNITGNVQVVVRARSAAPLPLGVLLRSGDGSSDFRTATLTQEVAGTLDAFTTLVYNFEGNDLGGFIPDDFQDLWLFLDQENENFPGNELYIDYIVIGPQPDSTLNAPCGLPDIVVQTSSAEIEWQFEVLPNPVSNQFQVSWNSPGTVPVGLFLYDARGKLVLKQQAPPTGRQSLDISEQPNGIYFLHLQQGRLHATRKIFKQ
jgi:hypothetical protein